MERKLFFAGLGRRHILDGSAGFVKRRQGGLFDGLGDLLGMLGEVLEEDVTVREVALHSPRRGQGA